MIAVWNTLDHTLFLEVKKQVIYLKSINYKDKCPATFARRKLVF